MESRGLLNNIWKFSKNIELFRDSKLVAITLDAIKVYLLCIRVK